MADGASSATAGAALAAIIANAGYAQLHTADPGSAGTSNVSSTTTRQAVTWGTPASGSVSATNSPEWTSWAGTNGEVVTDLSFWSQPTGGTFAFSVPLSASVGMGTGDSLTLGTLTVAVPTAS